MLNYSVSSLTKQYLKSRTTVNFLQLQNVGISREKCAKRDQQRCIAGASGGYDEANPTFQAVLGKCFVGRQNGGVRAKGGCLQC